MESGKVFFALTECSCRLQVVAGTKDRAVQARAGAGAGGGTNGANGETMLIQKAIGSVLIVPRDWRLGAVPPGGPAGSRPCPSRATTPPSWRIPSNQNPRCESSNGHSGTCSSQS